MGRKVYVDVTVEFTKDGKMEPKSIRWQDGAVYEVQRVIDVRRAVSLRAGGGGIRYTCRIDGRAASLYFEENNKWFVEAR